MYSFSLARHISAVATPVVTAKKCGGDFDGGPDSISAQKI
jgi:hypothetical protein